MKRKVVGVLKMRNGSTIELIEGTMEKIEGFFDDDFLFQEPEYTNGEGKFLHDFLWHLTKHGHFCFCCKTKMPDFEPQYCCNGHECGCYGYPIEPPICSAICWELLLGDYMEYKDMWE